MRWAIVLVTCLNAAYFVWGYLQESQKIYQQELDRPEVPRQTGKRLILMTELEEFGKKAGAGSADQSPKGQAVGESYKGESGSGSGEKQCIVVGPFGSFREVDLLQQKLFSLGVPSRERIELEIESGDYWVHIPPRNSWEDAMRLLRELQEQGVDSFIITQGELANGISLGLFDREARAQEVRRRVNDIGYEVSIKTFPKEPETYWLELTSEAAVEVDDAFWREQKGLYRKLEIKQKACGDISARSTQP